jgi:small subunit ribosomal protein S15
MYTLHGDYGGRMALTTEQKTHIIEQYRRGESDCGSAEVQVALLTERIRQLTEHSKTHPQDHSSRRGLLKLVGQRRRMMRYLARTDAGRYRALIDHLGIRG